MKEDLSISGFSVIGHPAATTETTNIHGILNNIGTAGTVDLSNTGTYNNNYRISGLSLNTPTGTSLLISILTSPNSGVMAIKMRDG